MFTYIHLINRLFFNFDENYDTNFHLLKWNFQGKHRKQSIKKSRTTYDKNEYISLYAWGLPGARMSVYRCGIRFLLSKNYYNDTLENNDYEVGEGKSNTTTKLYYKDNEL